MQKLVIIFGIIILIIGLAWPLIKKLGLGRLPGDILVPKSNFTFYFPITTCIIISLIITLIIWLFKR
ncbi:MAG: DUF2905 domain-containing protein [Tatlockia sp.]|nr:DUF2905 domain-containing protein [Tatlockia sp.]